MSEADLKALTCALAGLGDQLLCVCGLRDEFPTEQPLFATARDAFNPAHAFESTVLGHIESAILSESEQWVMVCSPDGFSLLAGTREALHAVVEALGGESTVTARLAALIDEGELGEPMVVREVLARSLGQ